MYHKSLVFLVQSHGRKLFLINDLYLSDCKQCLGGAIDSPNKFLLCKPYVCIAESEKKHLQNYFYSSVGHQKDFLEESNFS